MTESSCLRSSDVNVVDENGAHAMCHPAFKVDVNSKGHIYMTPLEKGAFKWGGPGPYKFPSKGDTHGYGWGNLQCAHVNATGVFNGT
jgi:hypothetical protein